MAEISTIGHIGQGVCDHGMKCCPHTVKITLVQGSPDTKTNGSSVARRGDKVATTCPHCGKGVIVGGASDTIVNGSGVARKGDKVSLPGGSGVITQGSPDSYCN